MISVPKKKLEKHIVSINCDLIPQFCGKILSARARYSLYNEKAVCMHNPKRLSQLSEQLQ